MQDRSRQPLGILFVNLSLIVAVAAAALIPGQANGSRLRNCRNHRAGLSRVVGCVRDIDAHAHSAVAVGLANEAAAAQQTVTGLASGDDTASEHGQAGHVAPFYSFNAQPDDWQLLSPAGVTLVPQQDYRCHYGRAPPLS
jgi:hypothetical protein